MSDPGERPDRNYPARRHVRRVENRSAIVFVTVCTKDREGILANDRQGYSKTQVQDSRLAHPRTAMLLTPVVKCRIAQPILRKTSTAFSHSRPVPTHGCFVPVCIDQSLFSSFFPLSAYPKMIKSPIVQYFRSNVKRAEGKNILVSLFII